MPKGLSCIVSDMAIAQPAPFGANFTVYNHSDILTLALPPSLFWML